MFYKYNSLSGRVGPSSQISAFNPGALQSAPVEISKIVPESKKAAPLFNQAPATAQAAVKQAATKIPKGTLVLCGLASAVGYGIVMLKVWS